MTDADPLLPYRFTVRQRQVLKRIGQGKSYAEIAADLGISIHTVKVHAGLVKARIGYDSSVPTRAACMLFLRTATNT